MGEILMGVVLFVVNIATGCSCRVNRKWPSIRTPVPANRGMA